MGDAAAGDGAAITGRLRANSIPTSPRVLLTTEGPPDAALVTRERSSSQRSHLGDESSEGEMGTAARAGGRTARDPLMARFQQRLQASSSMEELPAAPAPSRLQAADAAERIQLEDASSLRVSAEDAIRQISSKPLPNLSTMHKLRDRLKAKASGADVNAALAVASAAFSVPASTPPPAASTPPTQPSPTSSKPAPPKLQIDTGLSGSLSQTSSLAAAGAPPLQSVASLIREVHSPYDTDDDRAMVFPIAVPLYDRAPPPAVPQPGGVVSAGQVGWPASDEGPMRTFRRQPRPLQSDDAAVPATPATPASALVQQHVTLGRRRSNSNAGVPALSINTSPTVDSGTAAAAAVTPMAPPTALAAPAAPAGATATPPTQTTQGASQGTAPKGSERSSTVKQLFARGQHYLALAEEAESTVSELAPLLAASSDAFTQYEKLYVSAREEMVHLLDEQQRHLLDATALLSRVNTDHDKLGKETIALQDALDSTITMADENLGALVSLDEQLQQLRSQQHAESAAEVFWLFLSWILSVLVFVIWGVSRLAMLAKAIFTRKQARVLTSDALTEEAAQWRERLTALVDPSTPTHASQPPHGAAGGSPERHAAASAAAPASPGGTMSPLAARQLRRSRSFSIDPTAPMPAGTPAPRLSPVTRAGSMWTMRDAPEAASTATPRVLARASSAMQLDKDAQWLARRRVSGMLDVPSPQQSQARRRTDVATPAVRRTATLATIEDDEDEQEDDDFFVDAQ